MLFEGSAAGLRRLRKAVAAAEGPIRPVLTPQDGLYRLDMLVAERSTNTADAGGNASLMSL